MTTIELDTFTRSYIEAALWTSMDESDDSGGEPMDRNYDIDDIHPDTLEHMRIDCEAFQEKYGNIIDGAELEDLHRASCNRDLAGYHFWLTRNGHGAGFWDGDWPDPIGDQLTEASKHFGEYDLYIGDDGAIHGCRC
jgi:hypothetical protein